MPLPVAAGEGAEDSATRGHLKEARTYLPQRAVVKTQTPRSKDPTQEATGGTLLLRVWEQKENVVTSRSAEAKAKPVCESKKACPPGGRITNISSGRTGQEAGACAGNPGRTRHPFSPGWGCGEGSPAWRSAPTSLACLDTLTRPPGPCFYQLHGLTENRQGHPRAPRRCRKEHRSIFLASKQCGLI